MQALLWSLVTVLMLALAFVVRPTRYTCPPDWYINGVRPDGEFEVRPRLGDPERDVADARARLVLPDDRAFRSRVYCPGDQHPVLVGFRVVECRR